MELEVVEPAGGLCEIFFQKEAGCSEVEYFIGCCIIHFWCWEPGTGLCC